MRLSKAVLISLAASLAQAAASAQTLASSDGLADLSLEQLTQVRVSTVSRRFESLAEAPASLYVISRDDIQRSGYTSLPELLRLAPNLQVARLNASEYAISARGHNSTTANKLQVLIDGRSVYTPLYSGVFWDVQDVVLADVERIEVISGPGATTWGSNAVNGVINVVTRRTNLTKGGIAQARGGGDHVGALARYGGEFKAGGHYRVYAKQDSYAAAEQANGASSFDSWKKSQAGFRLDLGSQTEGATVLGNAYSGTINQPALDRRYVAGANIQTRIFRPLVGGGRRQLLLYYDGTRRDHAGTYEERLDIFDIELMQVTNLNPEHTLSVSGGYRHARDRIVNPGPVLAFLPPDRDLHWANLVVVDDVRLTPATRVAIGGRAEYNIFTHWEFLPSLRVSHRTGDTSTLWGALSRSVRTPSRVDRDLHVSASAGLPAPLAGGPDFDAEVANVAEIGYRAQPSPAFSYSLTTFYHRFKRLRGFGIEGANLVINNSIDGHTYGAEGWATYRVNPQWRIDAGFLRQRQRYQRQAAGLSDSIGNDPKYQVQLRTTIDLPANVDLSLALRHVSALPSPAVPAYTVADMRVAWQVDPRVSLFGVVSNLGDEKHREWGLAGAGEFGRTASVGLTVSF